ncbi:MAG: hypothetical protein WBJ12_00210 [Dethiobacteria bacterium]
MEGGGGVRALGGTLAALGLLAAGLLFLPAPEGSSTGGIFAALWLLVTGISALAFLRELTMLLRLSQIRSRWMRAAKRARRRPAGDLSRVTPLRERERRLD